MARTSGHGNPKWGRDETILALDLYISCGENMPSSEDSRVLGLSRLLRALPHHALASRKASFRNPAGVAFKLQNLRQVATGKGLGNVSEMDRKVWADFGKHPEKLSAIANAIRSGVTVSISNEDHDLGDDEDEFPEGAVLTAIHKRRERNRKIRKSLLSRRRKTGRLACDICSALSKFSDASIEDAMFEAHHIVPVSKSPEKKTRLSEMALLCANCHRSLHRLISRGGKWLDIVQSRELFKKGS